MDEKQLQALANRLAGPVHHPELTAWQVVFFVCLPQARRAMLLIAEVPGFIVSLFNNQKIPIVIRIYIDYLLKQDK